MLIIAAVFLITEDYLLFIGKIFFVKKKEFSVKFSKKFMK